MSPELGPSSGRRAPDPSGPYLDADPAPAPAAGIAHDVLRRLRCPACNAGLTIRPDWFECTRLGCDARYPVVHGIPILINEARSLFRIDDLARRLEVPASRAGGLADVARAAIDWLPAIGRSVGARRNYSRLLHLLRSQSPSPSVLVVGGGVEGEGMSALTAAGAGVTLTETDVVPGPRTMLLCDAHDLPFEDGTFDGVVVQAVLEHVVDPYRCTDEIHRVLNANGLVYAETPFMQQVHMGAYDFHRFTHSGHRRLFRRFEEIDSGPICGPGMALAWSYQYFLLSFSGSKWWRAFARAFSSLTAFHLKYFDHILIDKPPAVDAASGCYFLGRKSTSVMPDRDLVAYYRGAQA